MPDLFLVNRLCFLVVVAGDGSITDCIEDRASAAAEGVFDILVTAATTLCREADRNLVFDFAGEAGHSIDHLTVLRDGKIYEDVGTIREGLAAVDVSDDLVGVRKSDQPRVGHRTNDGGRIAYKRVAFVAPERDRAVLHSYGMPDYGEELATGSPQTIGLREDTGPTDITTLT